MKKMRIFSVALAACMAVGAAAGCSGGGDKGDYAVKAVSYTHLTLPTKLEV